MIQPGIVAATGEHKKGNESERALSTGCLAIERFRQLALA